MENCRKPTSQGGEGGGAEKICKDLQELASGVHMAENGDRWLTQLYPTWATGQAGIVLVPSATIKVPLKKREKFVGAAGFSMRWLQQETGEWLALG